MPLARKNCSRASTSRRPRRRSGVTTSDSERVPIPATCGRSRRPVKRAAAEVEEVELHLRRGVREGQAGDDGPQQRRLPGPRATPTTATWPAAPERSARSSSRRCSSGACRRCRAGTAAARASARSAMISPSSGSTARSREHLVEGVGDVERRQPDLVGGGAVAASSARRRCRRRSASPSARRGGSSAARDARGLLRLQPRDDRAGDERQGLAAGPVLTRPRVRRRRITLGGPET